MLSPTSNPSVSRRGIAVDLFSCAGGLSLGVEQAGFNVALGADDDPVHCAVHKYNFPYGRALATDLSTATGRSLRQAGAGNEDIDIVTLGRLDAVFGGPPCQGFSRMGRQDLSDPRNLLVSHFQRLVGELEPRFAVMENVAGLTDQKFAPVLDHLLESFHRIGYNVVTPIRVLNAIDYGVPQSRERVFLLIYRRGERPPSYPEPTHARGGLDLLLNPAVTVGDALSGLPEADLYPALYDVDEVAVSGPWSSAGMPMSPYALAMRGLSNDPDDLSYRRIWNPSLLTNSGLVRHAAGSVARYAATAPGTQCEGHNLMRLHLDRQAPTLRAGSLAREHDGRRHSAQTAARPIHPTRPRVITVREGCRLHSIPDWFRVHGTKMQGFREVGNSVPPRLARAVAHEIRKAAGLNPAQPCVEIATGPSSLLTVTPSTAMAALVA